MIAVRYRQPVDLDARLFGGEPAGRVRWLAPCGDHMDLMAPRYEAPGQRVGASAAGHIRSVEVLVEVDYAHLFPNPWYAELLRCGLPPVRRRRARLPRPYSQRRPKAAQRYHPT